MNVQVLSDPAGRLVWASPALPGARHDMGAAGEHGMIDALAQAGIQVVVDSDYRGAGPIFNLPQRRRTTDPDTERTRLSAAQREVNAAHAAQRGPGERANAALKTWKVLRKSAAARSGRRPWSRPYRYSSSLANAKWKGLPVGRPRLVAGGPPARRRGPRRPEPRRAGHSCHSSS